MADLFEIVDAGFAGAERAGVLRAARQAGV